MVRLNYLLGFSFYYFLGVLGTKISRKNVKLCPFTYLFFFNCSERKCTNYRMLTDESSFEK